jgi:hypothetical protein
VNKVAIWLRGMTCTAVLVAATATTGLAQQCPNGWVNCRPITPEEEQLMYEALATVLKVKHFPASMVHRCVPLNSVW